MILSVKTLGTRIIVLLSLVACTLTIAYAFALAHGIRPLPGLVADADSGGGPIMKGCPIAPGGPPAPTLGGPSSTSADIDRRLKEHFPPGTPQILLVQYLKERGFRIQPPCPGYPNIRSAFFTDITLLSPIKYTSAAVYWKHDASGRVVRAWGFVDYGPLYL